MKNDSCRWKITLKSQRGLTLSSWLPYTQEAKTSKMLAKTFKPRVHDDDRRRGTFDVFHTPSGDINYSVIYSGAIAAWHRHAKQTDHWFVIKGSLKVGLYDEKTKTLEWVYLHGQDRQTLVIPPGIWHGWRCLSPGETILSYYISEKYDLKNPDEERKPIGAFGENWGTETK